MTKSSKEKRENGVFQTLAYYSSVFYRDFVAYTAKKLQSMGLHYGLLFFVVYIGKHPGASPSEMTSALHVDWGHSQRSITKLVEDGFMTKEKQGRSYVLNLTPKGQQAFELSHQVFADWDAQRLSGLTQAERETLMGLLGKIAVQKEAEKHV